MEGKEKEKKKKERKKLTHTQKGIFSKSHHLWKAKAETELFKDTPGTGEIQD